MVSESGITDFAASCGWLHKFLKRFNLTIRRRTATGQSWKYRLEIDILHFFVIECKNSLLFFIIDWGFSLLFRGVIEIN